MNRDAESYFPKDCDYIEGDLIRGIDYNNVLDTVFIFFAASGISGTVFMKYLEDRQGLNINRSFLASKFAVCFLGVTSEIRNGADYKAIHISATEEVNLYITELDVIFHLLFGKSVFRVFDELFALEEKKREKDGKNIDDDINNLFNNLQN